MAGLTVQNFVSAATGIALAVALVRGFARRSATGDRQLLGRSDPGTLYVLLPICIVYALFLVWQGVPQNLSAYVDATTLEGAQQTIAQGPVASQEAIKMLGTNGGGFFNANSAHPLREPDAALEPHPDGLDLRDRRGADQRLRPHGRRRAPGLGDPRRHGVIFVAGVAVAYCGRGGGQRRRLSRARAATAATWRARRSGSASPLSALFAVITTAASCGAVNAMHDSFTALGGMIPLINMELGEVVIGGVGAGLYGMLLFVDRRDLRRRADGRAHAGISSARRSRRRR